MFLGIDVGGTHTDAVLMHDGEMIASCKAPTNHDNLLLSVTEALESVLRDQDRAKVSRLNLSTTLSTNAIVENTIEEAGVLVTAGPGLDPEEFRIGRDYAVIPGAMDHRGEEIAPLDVDKLDQALQAFQERGLKVFSVVGKFSTRNPAHERLITERIKKNGLKPDFISMGHRLSGLLNFPRRISTAFYNSAVWRVYNTFADSVAASIKDQGLTCGVNVLKADGGTMPLARSRELPVESIHSGPAASVMGIIALCDIREDCVILDIGGTTTDIALFASGSPLIEPQGIDIGSYPTLVKAMRTVSIGVGGDSRVHISAGEVRVGPERMGPPMALGGKVPTLVDAFNFKGLTRVGDVEASTRGLEGLAGLWDTFAEVVAEKAIVAAVSAIKEAVDDLVWSVNQRPVYTIRELLTGKVLEPRKIYLMGGPAEPFRKLLIDSFGCIVHLPQEYSVANAIGAALTRTTCEAELIADTEKGRLFIPNLGIEKDIGKGFGKEDAERELRERLLEYLCGLDPEDYASCRAYKGLIEVTESESFNMVDVYGSTARNIRVKSRIRPGIHRK